MGRCRRCGTQAGFKRTLCLSCEKRIAGGGEPLTGASALRSAAEAPSGGRRSGPSHRISRSEPKLSPGNLARIIGGTAIAFLGVGWLALIFTIETPSGALQYLLPSDPPSLVRYIGEHAAYSLSAVAIMLGGLTLLNRGLRDYRGGQ